MNDGRHIYDKDMLQSGLCARGSSCWTGPSEWGHASSWKSCILRPASSTAEQRYDRLGRCAGLTVLYISLHSVFVTSHHFPNCKKQSSVLQAHCVLTDSMTINTPAPCSGMTSILESAPSRTSSCSSDPTDVPRLSNELLAIIRDTLEEEGSYRTLTSLASCSRTTASLVGACLPDPGRLVLGDENVDAVFGDILGCEFVLTGHFKSFSRPGYGR